MEGKEMQIVLVFIVCLAASTLGGICGIGGGVVIKPLLDAMGLMSVSAVSFLSGLTVLAMAVVSIWKNRHGRELEMSRSIPLGIGAAIGGVAGKQLFEMVKAAAGADNAVGVVQAALLALMVAGTFVYTLFKSRIVTKEMRHPLPCVLVGLALGMCSAFLGIGGGPMNLVVLSYCFSMDSKKAAMNSILIILLSQIANFLFSLLGGSIPAVQWPMLIVMVLAGITGGSLSASLRKKIDLKQTDRLFLGMLVIIFLICIYNMFRLGA